MAEVLLFHHAHGRTPGVLAFADEIRSAGHTVHVPDLYEGRIFDRLEAGIGYASEVGLDTIMERGLRAAEGLPKHVVYAGFSLGVMPAQKLAQTQQDAAGALFFHACIRAAELGCPWPEHVPLQVHGMAADELFVAEGDLDAARELVASAGNAALFLYPGDQHLFTDKSQPSYDKAAAALLIERVIRFLNAIR